MKGFVKECRLVVIDQTVPSGTTITETYRAISNSAASWIDHFISSPSRVQKIEVVDDCDNFSDHLPLFAVLEISHAAVVIEETHCLGSRPAFKLTYVGCSKL